MSPMFSPGGFSDTAFARVYFGATDVELRLELLQSGASIGLFDFDAVKRAECQKLLGGFGVSRWGEPLG